MHEGYHRENLKAAIITTATDLLETVGDAEFSLRRIAKELNVSHQAPYKHFSSKGDVLHAVRQEGFRTLTLQMREAIRRHPRSPNKQLEVAGKVYVSNATKHPALYRLMFGQRLAETEHGNSTAKESFRLLTSIIEGAKVSPNLAVTRAQSFWAAMHGLSSLQIGGYFRVKTTQIAEFVEQALK